MGDFNHGNIKWDSLQSTGVEDQRFLCLVQDNFLTQHVLDPTRAARVLDIVLSSQKEFVDNVVIQEPLGSSDHNQLHFNINIKSDKTKVKQCRRDFRTMFMVLCSDSTTATIQLSLPLFRPVGCHPLCGGAGSLFYILKPATFSSFLSCYFFYLFFLLFM